MHDLAELRIPRTPVSQNAKCESCVHYDGNAAAKAGVCEVGTFPNVCGSGTDMKYGYAPLDKMGPDEIDDLATPQLAGQVGAMNEYGNIEPLVQMKTVVLGDEDLSIAQRILGERSKMFKAFGESQGEVNYHSRSQEGVAGTDDTRMFHVAKSLHEMYFAPRKQKKFSVVDVLDFMKSNGMDVTDADMEMAMAKGEFGNLGRTKAPAPFTKKPDMRGAQAASGQTHGAAPSGKAPSMHFSQDGKGGHVASTATHDYYIAPMGKEHQLSIRSKGGSGNSTVITSAPTRAAAGERAMAHANKNMAKSEPWYQQPHFTGKHNDPKPVPEAQHSPETKAANVIAKQRGAERQKQLKPNVVKADVPFVKPR